MKKILLLSLTLISVLTGVAQVTFYVDPPAINNGSHGIVDVADQINNGWGTPDMTNPINAITGEMVLVDDGTADDSLGCNTLTNNLEIDGNIAVVYRGECEFGAKAFNAQTAGAIGVIIINNDGIDAFSMLGGTDGPNVTIPVIMISMSSGQLLADDIATGTNTCFIGNKFGYFLNDLGCRKENTLRPNQFGNVKTFSQDDTEFSVKMGTWIFNFGQNDQTDVVLTGTVALSNQSLYSEASTPIDILSGDSTFVSLPTFSQTTYANGYYRINYSISSGNADDFEDDNTINADFAMTEESFSYARLDSTNFQPYDYSGSRATETNDFSACIFFSNPNASRMGAKGLSFSASAATDFTLDGELITIDAYEWTDAITDLNDASFTLSNSDFLTSGEFNYDGDFQDSIMTAFFEEPFLLEDSKNYFFCASTANENVYIGFDRNLDYSENINDITESPTTNNGTPTTVIRTDDGLSMFQATDLEAAITLNLFPAIELGVEDDNNELELTAYPNPANETLNIPMLTKDGTVTISIFDTTGKLVDTKLVNSTSTNNLSLDVSNLESGLYMFNVKYEDGTNTTMNIVINK